VRDDALIADAGKPTSNYCGRRPNETSINEPGDRRGGRGSNKGGPSPVAKPIHDRGGPVFPGGEEGDRGGGKKK